MFAKILTAKDSIYQTLYDEAGVGPFDGGCLMLAVAIQKTFNRGELCALVDEKGVLHHAVVRFGSLFVDADGFFTEENLREFWRQEELICIADIRATSIEEFLACDGSLYSPRVVDKLTNILR